MWLARTKALRAFVQHAHESIKNRLKAGEIDCLGLGLHHLIRKVSLSVNASSG